MRVLVTGAAGFIGGAVARRLAASGQVAEVVALDQLPVDAAERIRPLRADLAEVAALRIGRLDVVVHCAGLTSQACEADPDAAVAVNVRGTSDLLASIRPEGPAARFVFASTLAVFGGGAISVDENSPVEARSTYGITKASAETHLLGENDTVIVRLPVVGPRTARVGRPGAGYLSDLLAHVAAGRPFTAPLAEGRSIPVAPLDLAVDVLVDAALSEAPARQIRHVPGTRAPGTAVTAILAAAGWPTDGIAFESDPAVERLVQGWPAEFRSLSPEPPPVPLATIVRRGLDIVRTGNALVRPVNDPACSPAQ